MHKEAIITIDNLYLSYGKIQAVNGLSLTIHAGECFGLLGPNGAGKTTTLSCLEGLAQPDRGTINIKGVDALKERKRGSDRWSCTGEVTAGGRRDLRRRCVVSHGSGCRA